MKNVYNKLRDFPKGYFIGGILMKIQLPKTFEYHDGPTHAVVHNGVLEMTPIDFEKTMYHLTYRLKGRVRCAYCHRVLEANKLTLDHVFPRDHGGISISNNLKPCCKRCNEAKNNLLPWQYSSLQKLSKKSKVHVEEQYQYENMQARRECGILIPKEWYEMRRNYSVFALITSERPFKESRKYQRVLEMYETYGKICKPIVVSQNRFVLDGFTALLVAKNLGLDIPLSFITLENVIVI